MKRTSLVFPAVKTSAISSFININWATTRRFEIKLAAETVDKIDAETSVLNRGSKRRVTKQMESVTVSNIRGMIN